MTTSSPTYLPGDVLRAPMLFTDQRGLKSRPLVVVSVAAVQASRADVVVVPLSTQAGGHFADRPLRDWHEAGLREGTYIKAILGTIKQSNVESVWGRLSQYDFDQVQNALREVLGL